MKKLLLFSLLICISACSKKTLIVNQQGVDITWLTGVWKNKNKEVYEKWSKISDVEYIGVGYNMDQGYATITENLKIYKDGKDWYLDAKTKDNNFTSVIFKLIPDPVLSLKFVNEKHDFPKVVSYKKESFDVMTACISDLDGTKAICSENMRFVNK